MIYKIWTEGFHVNEGKSGASFVASVEANSFREACNKYADQNPGWKNLYDSERLTLWGCNLFDNEVDAKKSFG